MSSENAQPTLRVVAIRAAKITAAFTAIAICIGLLMGDGSISPGVPLIVVLSAFWVSCLCLGPLRDVRNVLTLAGIATVLEFVCLLAYFQAMQLIAKPLDDPTRALLPLTGFHAFLLVSIKMLLVLYDRYYPDE